MNNAEKHRLLQTLSEAAEKATRAHHCANEALLEDSQDEERGIRTVSVTFGWMAYTKDGKSATVSVSEGPQAALNHLRAMLAENKEDNA